MDHLMSQFLILVATIDPFGTLAMFVGLTSGVTPPERRRIAVRCVVAATVILLGFIVAGQLLLDALSVRIESFELAGGLIFLLFGIQMVFGTGAAGHARPEPDHDVAMFPLAVPSIASPGSILAVVILTDNGKFTIAEQAVTAALLLGVMGLTLSILLLAGPIHRMLGRAGANLMVRVLGLVLSSLAVEMILEAVFSLIYTSLSSAGAG